MTASEFLEVHLIPYIMEKENVIKTRLGEALTAIA
jgi:hypothetical protein